MLRRSEQNIITSKICSILVKSKWIKYIHVKLKIMGAEYRGHAWVESVEIYFTYLLKKDFYDKINFSGFPRRNTPVCSQKNSVFREN